MSTQKKWKLAQTLCLAVMLAGVIGLGISVFGEAGPPLRGAKRQRRHSAVGQPGARPGPTPPEGEVNLSPGGS